MNYSSNEIANVTKIENLINIGSFELNCTISSIFHLLFVVRADERQFAMLTKFVMQTKGFTKSYK